MSVAEQEADVEHIIIDGGSTDGTVEIIRKHQNKLAHWVSEPDSGQPEAINKGLALANGDFFNWLNADDRLTPNALVEVKRQINENVDVIVGICEHVNQQGDVIAAGSAKVWSSVEATLGNYSMGQPSVFYRTEVMMDLGGLNESLHLCMDMDLWFRFLLKHGQEHVLSMEQTLSKFLVREGSKSEALSTQMRDEKYGIYKALLTSNSGCEQVDEFFNGFEIPKGVYYSIEHLSKDEILSNFAWHLLVESYQNKTYDKAISLLQTVARGTRLSNSEQLEWKARIASKKLLKK